MPEHNPYSAPEAVVAEAPVARGAALAGRGERFGAACIDGIIMMAILLPAMYYGGYFTGIMSGARPGLVTQLLWALFGFAIFVAVQGYPLSATGQTWGKKLLKMKIVDMDGAKPDLAKLILMRYLPTQAISQVPIVGAFYSIVDVLFIFAEDRRCIHDRIAGTRVVVAD